MEKKNIKNAIDIGCVFFYLLFASSSRGGGGISPLSFFKQLYTTGWNFTFWYIYAYIAYLITLPFLRKMATNLSAQEYYYMIMLALTFGAVIPIIEYVLWNDEIKLYGYFSIAWLTSNIVLYPSVGYFLQHKRNVIDKKHIVALWAINMFLMILSAYLTFYKMKITNQYLEGQAQTFMASFALVNAITIFVTTKYVFATFTISITLKKIILSLGRSTFGIYLLHLLIIQQIPVIYRLWDVFRNKWHMNYMISAFLYCAVAMLIGYVVTQLLKKIPFVKKLI